MAASMVYNIGAGILKRFIVTFDYPNEVVYFQPVSRFNQLNRIRNMAGLELKRDGDGMLVADILPGRSAAITFKRLSRLDMLRESLLPSAAEL